MNREMEAKVGWCGATVITSIICLTILLYSNNGDFFYDWLLK